VPTVTVKRGEPVDKALRRLKKKMSNEGIIKWLRDIAITRSRVTAAED